jgi:DNA-binding transcriptional ArsR family regulator
MDRVFKALGDRSRRKMLDLLAERPRTTGELAAAFPRLSRFAVMKHLSVLSSAGLLVVTRDGRKRWNAINAAPLREVLPPLGREERTGVGRRAPGHPRRRGGQGRTRKINEGDSSCEKRCLPWPLRGCFDVHRRGRAERT